MALDHACLETEPDMLGVAPTAANLRLTLSERNASFVTGWLPGKQPSEIEVKHGIQITPQLKAGRKTPVMKESLNVALTLCGHRVVCGNCCFDSSAKALCFRARTLNLPQPPK